MMCMIKKRANSPEQKALRRQQILLAARRRFEKASFEEVNLNLIAADVGMTKAALYRYFRNKETLFLALFVVSLDELVNAAEAETLDKPLASAITHTLLANPMYCKLSAILHTILERNLTLEEASDFKTTLLSLLGKYAEMITRHSSLDLPQAIRLLMQVQEAVIGCWHMSHPTGAIAEAISQPSLQIFRQDFDSTLLSHIERLIPDQN